MKLCKDCKHAVPESTFNTLFLGRPTARSWKYAGCSHPNLVRLNVDPTNGETTTLQIYCSVQRDFECGEKAKYFEPRK